MNLIQRVNPSTGLTFMGVDEKITDYVDMGRSMQKFDLFCVKSKIRFTFSDKMSIFLIYLYISSILYH